MTDNENKLFARLGVWWVNYGKALNLALRGVGRDNISMMASGMVYSTLIAIIPCLTFLFAFLSAFGVLQPFMDLIREIAIDTFGKNPGNELMGYIEQFSSNAMSLGVIGLISFIFTGILLVNKIYTVINHIFRTHASSGTVKRFTAFLTFLIIGAFIVVMVFALQGMVGGTLRNMVVGDETTSNFLYTALMFFVGLVFLFLLFYAVPNTKIRFVSAAVGATTCMVLLMIITALFSKIASMMVSYSVIYGSMASIFVALLYLYIVWFAVFFSAELVFVHQFKPDKSFLLGSSETPYRQLSEAVNALLLIADRYQKGEGPMSQRELIRKLAIPSNRLVKYLSDLEDASMIMAVNTQRTLFVPARPLEQITVSRVISALFGDMDAAAIETIGEAVASEFLHRGIADTGNITVENLLERV